MLHPPVVVHRLLQGHFVDVGRDVLFLGQFTSTPPAIPGHQLVLSILPQPEDDGFFYAAGLDAADQAAVTLVRLFLDKYAGQIMDF